MRLIILCFLFCMSSVAFAAESSKSGLKQTEETTSGQENIEEMTVDQRASRFWGLTSAEWDRYLLVKQFSMQFGNKSTESTPLEVLAIFADNEMDRARYAKIFTKKYDLFTQNLLKTDAAITQAQAVLYKNKPMLSQSRLNRLVDAPMNVSDRVQFFTQVGECVGCDKMLRQLIRQSRMYGSNLDVFVSNAGYKSMTDAELQAFAKEFIPQDLAEEGLITINHDSAFSKKHKLKLPTAFISRQNGPLEAHDPSL